MSLIDALRRIDRYLGVNWKVHTEVFRNPNNLYEFYLESSIWYYDEIRQYFQETNDGAQISNPYGDGYFGPGYSYRVISLNDRDIFMTFQRNERYFDGTDKLCSLLRILYTYDISLFKDGNGDFKTTERLIKENPFIVAGKQIGNPADWM